MAAVWRSRRWLSNHEVSERMVLKNRTMELRHLETFATVLARASFLGAARALGCSQSTVTLHIQLLEKELGAPLFVRAHRRVQLTEAGELLGARCRGILDGVAALRRSIDELGHGAAGHVAAGAIEPSASLRLAPLVARFCAVRPALRLRLEVGGSETIARGVAEGTLDLGIASPPAPALRLGFEPLFREEMALLVPRRHVLARARCVRARDLAAVPLLLTEQGCAYRETTERRLAERGVGLRRGTELGSIPALQHAVRAGLGVAVVPAAGPPPPSGTVLRRVEDLDLALTVGLVRRLDGPPASPAVAAFADEVRRLRR